MKFKGLFCPVVLNFERGVLQIFWGRKLVAESGIPNYRREEMDEWDWAEAIERAKTFIKEGLTYEDRPPTAA